MVAEVSSPAPEDPPSSMDGPPQEEGTPTTVAESLVWLSLAFALNAYLDLTILHTHALYLGQTLALLALLTHGWRLAGLVSLSAAAGLYVDGGDALRALLTLAEVAAVALALRQRVPIVLSALTFWVLAGGPTYEIAGALRETVVGLPLRIDTLVVVINALLGAALAGALSRLVIGPLLHLRIRRVREVPLQRQALGITVTLVVLPTLCVSTVILDRSVAILGDELRDRLHRNATDYAALTEMYLTQHLDTVALLADRHREGPDSTLLADLESVQRGMPGFLTMIAVGPDAQVIHGVPSNWYNRVVTQLTEAQRNVADREYYWRAKDARKPVISNGIIGRGFGEDPIIGVSAPLLNQSGAFLGVIQGSLSLPRFSDIGDAQENSVKMIVLDRAGQIVGASLDLRAPQGPLELLSTGRFENTRRASLVDLPSLTLGNDTFLYASADLLAGWRVYALTPTTAVASVVQQVIVAFLLGMLTLLALGAAVSEGFIRSLTQPMQALLDQVLDPDRRTIELPAWQRTCPEITDMERALRDAREVTANFRERVEQEIADKTRQLVETNRSLAALTLEDPLTGISNRRGLELGAQTKLAVAAREGLELTVAMIDADHFKDINDRYGHKVGDVCIRLLAGRLRESFRRSVDLVARYGGEEFAIITLSQGDDEPTQRLETFRQAVADEPFDEAHAGLFMTVSIGVVSVVPTADLTLETLFDRADKALYVSKREGRNRLTVYGV